MTAAARIRRLWEHLQWADAELLAAMRRASPLPDEALREYAHLLGAEDVWLSRLERRAARSAIWPTLSLDEAESLARANRDGYARFMSDLTDTRLEEMASYANSAGQAFETEVGDVLLHVALHGQYHRGKVNLLLRQHGRAPVTLDYIAFVRAHPAPRAVPDDVPDDVRNEASAR